MARRLPRFRLVPRRKSSWLVVVLGALLSLWLLRFAPESPAPGGVPAERPRLLPPPPPTVEQTARAPEPPQRAAVQDAARDEVPPGYRLLRVAGAVTNVHDGDTFTADLDGDGRAEAAGERVRLLFVDTPELGESWKGKDPAHGLPARDFLAELLRRGPVELLVPAERPTDRYGRTLALVRVAGEYVNLALLRAGHSPFDTRFGFPQDYTTYLEAEAEAFQARRGIWADAESRIHYLERLQREHRTPAAPDNKLYVEPVLEAAALKPATYLGRYIRARGTLLRMDVLNKNVRRLRIGNRGREGGLKVVAFPGTAQRLGLPDWPIGARVQVEGFIQAYQGGLEMRLHWAQRER